MHKQFLVASEKITLLRLPHGSDKVKKLSCFHYSKYLKPPPAGIIDTTNLIKYYELARVGAVVWFS